MTNLQNKTIKQPGIDLIKSHEKLRLGVYLCPSNKVTIGYGHVILPLHDVVLFKNVTSSALYHMIQDCERLRKITQEAKESLFISPIQADALINGDTRQVANYLNSVLRVDINQNQFDALCSLVFNIGQGNFSGSTIRKLINSGDFPAAAAEFDRWIYGTVNGKKQKLNGLIARRAEERALFESVWSDRNI